MQDHPALEEHGFVAQAGQPAQVVRGDEDRVSVLGESADHCCEGVFGGGVHACEGLVEQEQGSGLGDRAGDEHAFALPTGELSDLPVCEVGHADTLERSVHRFVIGRFGPAQPPLVAVPAGHHDLAYADGEVPVDGLGLGYVRHLCPATGRCRQRPADGYPAAGRPHQPHHGLEQGRLSRAVRSHEAADHARIQCERDTLERQNGVVPHGEVVDVERGRAHRVSPETIVETSWRSRSR